MRPSRARSRAASRLRLTGGEVEYEIIRPAPGRPNAPVIVLLHEGLGSLGLWRGFPRLLHDRTGLGVLVWSRHGYGNSDPAPRPFGPDYLHREALEAFPELLDRLDIVDPLLVGHSDGASIAIIYGGCSGRHVAGLVLIAPHVTVEDRALAGIEVVRRRYLDSDLPQRMGRYHRDPDAAFWNWNRVWLSPEFRSWNIEECLAGLRCPVLAVQCEDDPYGTLEQLERVGAGVRGPYSRLVLPSGGHSPHESHPQEVVESIGAFVEALTGEACSAGRPSASTSGGWEGPRPSSPL